MRSPSLRRWLVASAAITLGAAGVVAAQLSSGVAGATVTIDTVQYVQGATASSFNYVPGNGGTTTVQPINFSGTCKTPAYSPSPLLVLSAQSYLSPVNGVPYTGPATAEPVGTNQARTGVCEKSPAWSISPNQSLFFAAGTNALVSGRTFSEAQIPVVLNGADSDIDTNTATLVLIERNGSTVVGTQSLVVTGATGTTATADTGVVAGGFSSIELRVTNVNQKGGQKTNLSVINTANFLLQLLPQTITFTNTPPTSPIVGGTYTVTATGGASGNPVVFSVDGSSQSGCAVNASTGVVTLNGPAGSCVIDANQAGNGTYAPAPQVQQAVTVGKAPQTITFTSTPPSQPIAGVTYQVTATGGPSGNPVVISIDQSSTSGCTIDPSTKVVTFKAPTGNCVIDANQAGNASYLPAPQAQQTVIVYQTICGQQTITTQSSDGTNGQITASFTFQDFNGQPAPPSVCKTYQTFSASANSPVPGLTGNQTVTFTSNPLATAHVTATIAWATHSFCTPDGSGGTPQCPPTFVSFDDGQTWQRQTYCSSAQAAGIPWCTTSRSYTITSQGTQITETWDGYGDPLFHNG